MKLFFFPSENNLKHSKREIGLILLITFLLLIWIFGYQKSKFSPTDQTSYPPAPFLKLSASDISAPQIRLSSNLDDVTVPDYSNSLAPLLLFKSGSGDVTFGFRIQASLEYHN